MNQSNFFSHNLNARNDNKIINLRMTLGAEGYGIFFMLLERLGEEADYMSVKDYNMIAFDLRVDASKVKKVVEDFGLFVFTEDGKYFYSESFNERMAIKDNASKKKSIAGKKGANKRWGNNSTDIAQLDENNSTAIAQLDENIAIKGKETTRKETTLKQQQEKDVVVVNNAKIKQIAKIYESSGFGQVNYIVSQKFMEMARNYEISWIEEAFEIAVTRNKHRLDYVIGILENWRRDGKNTPMRKTKNSRKNKFHNFEQITDNYSAKELEDIAMRKQQEGFKNLGLDDKE